MAPGATTPSIAVIGERGIPAKYSGFSTLVEEVSTRLVSDHDMQVTVYCRPQYYPERAASHRGVRTVYVPAPGGKGIESLAHSACSTLHAIFSRYDLVFIVDPGNSPLVLPLRMRGLPVVLHTDGLGWQRRKWGRLARRYYKWSERVAAFLSTELVTDSKAMQAYYREQYRAPSHFIPYGSHVGPPASTGSLSEFDLVPGGYLLVVARMEPENNADLVIREYRLSGVEMPLVVVGGARYPTPYSRAVLAEADERVRMIGPQYDPQVLNDLYGNAYAYIHAHEVGGTNPSLLRALDHGLACASIDVVFHREVLEGDALYFDPTEGSLAACIRELVENPERTRTLGAMAAIHAEQRYRWDAVADGYARLFRRVLERGRSAGGAPDEELYRPQRFAPSAPSASPSAHETARPS